MSVQKERVLELLKKEIDNAILKEDRELLNGLMKARDIIIEELIWKKHQHKQSIYLIKIGEVK